MIEKEINNVSKEVRILEIKLISKMTKEQIQAIVAENIQLKEDNSKLKEDNSKLIKKQKEFQDMLIEKINALKVLGPWRRFWGYWRLVMDLITTIEQAISKSK